MTGDTIVSGEEKRLPQSPTSPTNTDNSGKTLRGDVFIDIENDDPNSQNLPSSRTPPVQGDAQPRNEKRGTNVFRRITKSLKSDPEPVYVTETKIRKLEATPNGFPRLAAFQASEANFSLYRSFSYLHSRLLLDLQDEITSLEKELDEIDWDDYDEDPDRLRSREIDCQRTTNDPNERTRRVILREIRQRLMEYDEVLIKARTLESFQRPSDRNYRSVRRYLYNEGPLMDSEMDAIRTKEDIISLRNGREWAAFDGAFEGVIGRTDNFLKKLFRLKNPPLQDFFRTPELCAKTSNKHVSYYSTSRIDKLINVFITLVIFALLIVPVITMYRLTSTNLDSDSGSAGGRNGTASSASSESKAESSSQRNTFNAVAVLIVFTLLFSAAMSLLTRAARHELFAASAAYCAILVVFIGNFTGPGN